MKHRTPAKLSVASVSCRYHPVWYDSGSVREASNREREPGCCELVGGGRGRAIHIQCPYSALSDLPHCCPTAGKPACEPAI